MLPHCKAIMLALAAVAVLAVSLVARDEEEDEPVVNAALGTDDACLALEPQRDRADCTLHALQRHSLKTESEGAAGGGDTGLVTTDVLMNMEVAIRDYHTVEDEIRERHLIAMNASGVSWSIPSKPPKGPMDYNGMAYPDLIISDDNEETHIFAIGDWGGMDGSFEPDPARHAIYAYKGGKEPGTHVMPRGRPFCKFADMARCLGGGPCNSQCGYVPEVDSKPQILVAEQFIKRAAVMDPKYILNVGDNFYWGGIEKDCGSPMDKIDRVTKHQFDTIFEDIYHGPGIDGKPWFSVLGNHDWGGRVFNNGWDQQIAYTWASPRWVMPAVYWSQKVKYLAFEVDYFMVDTNFIDAKPPLTDPSSNICSAEFNSDSASCASAGGPPSKAGCRDWFQKLWAEQKPWLQEKLKKSDATWQIAVTHFPCGYTGDFWIELYKEYGLDLLVTGHTHDQQLWKGEDGMLGGLPCFVTGGGGGITSEDSMLPGLPKHNFPHVVSEYGFFDLTISKAKIKIDAIDHTGKLVDTTTILPKKLNGTTTSTSPK